MRLNNYIKRAGQASIPTREISAMELERLHHDMTQIAADVISVSDGLGITVTLGGGSVLGAARHQGFIPWDDDIDINMPRKDWDVFASEFCERYGNKYLLYSPAHYKESVINAIRIYKRGTTLREVAHAPNEPNGIFIDIFLIENVPNNLLLRFLHGVLCEGLRFVASCTRLYEQREYIQSVFKDNKNALSDYKNRFRIGRIFSFLNAHQWSFLSYKVNGLCGNETSKMVTIPSGGKRYFGEMISRGSYFPPNHLPFCGHLWPVPRDYDKYLTGLYGEWRTVPPEDEREVHCLLELDFGADDNG